MDNERPFGHHTVKLRALLIPDSDPNGLSAADIVNAIGSGAVAFRAMFIPDGSDLPLPGYPWVEFGRVTLDRGPTRARLPASRKTSTTAGTTAEATGSDAGDLTNMPDLSVTASAVPGEAAGEAGVGWPAGVGDGGGIRLGGSGYSDIAAAMAAWNALSDPPVTLAALDAASASNPIVKSLAWAKDGRERK